MSETPTGPGWYQDPDDVDQLRYFDGVVWSSHTTPRVSATAGQSTIGRAVPTPSSVGRQTGTRHDVRTPWGGQDGSGAGSGGPSGGWGRPSSAPGPYGARADVLPDGAVLAEWWRRLLARLLDWMIASALGLVVAIPWLGDATRLLGDYFREAAAVSGGGAAPDMGAFVTELGAALVPVSLVSLAVSLAYEIGFLAWRSATPGKMALGTVVRRVGDGERLGLVTAVRRQVISVVASAMAFVPLLGVAATMLNVLDPAWLLWDGKRQTLHDKVADTVVVLKG